MAATDIGTAAAGDTAAGDMAEGIPAMDVNLPHSIQSHLFIDGKRLSVQP